LARKSFRKCAARRSFDEPGRIRRSSIGCDNPGRMLLLAALCLYQNTVFHRANRYHVEVARQARKQITNVLKGGASLAQNDPNLIGEVVRSNFGIKLTDDVFEKCLNEASQDRLPKSSFKVEGWLHRSLFIIPVLIGLGGIVLIGYFAWIGKLICTLCPQ